MTSDRRLAAIMFTDIVGYTALMAESEAKGHRVRERQGQVLRPLVEQYGGDWVQHVGDETLSSFPSATDAVNCALAIQAALEAEAELRVRVGVHLGEIVSREGSVHGDGVNIAARIRPLAEPGGICISDQVQHAIRNQVNIETVSLGEHELKNVGRPVSVFVVSGTAGKPPGRTPERSAERRDTIQSLAVLPLENLSGDPEQEYFSDGMTEAVISELARIGSLSVVSRTSVMQYKRARKPLPEIAQELGVDVVVEGTVMRAGDRVRITVQLIDARSDRHMWVERYDRELSDVLALHSEVALHIAEQVSAELTPRERAALEASRTVDPRAHDAYLRALQMRGPITFAPAVTSRVIAQLERAVDLDPHFAEAWVALASVRDTQLIMGSEREVPAAREAAERALTLDDRLGSAHAVMGFIRLHYDWDFAGAFRAFERAMRLSPSDPLVLEGYTWSLLWRGRTADALRVSERLLRVAPLDIVWRGQRLTHLVRARQYERVLQEAERVRELHPGFVHLEEMVANFALGKLEQAHRVWIAFLKRWVAAEEWQTDALERGWIQGGWEGSVRAWLGAGMEREKLPPHVYVALFYATIGETDEVFVWLERAYREHSAALVIELPVNPVFDLLRSDPRFDDLLRRIGFPES